MARSKTVTNPTPTALPGTVTYAVPSGSLLFDLFTRNLASDVPGGFPGKRVTLVYGPPGTNKSAFAINAMNNALAAGGVAYYLDVEGTTADAAYVNSFPHIVARPEAAHFSIDPTIEDGAAGVIAFITKTVPSYREACGNPDAPALVIWDSITASSPKAAWEKIHAGDETGSGMGSDSRALKEPLRMISSLALKHNVAVILISQARNDLAALSGFGHKKESDTTKPSGGFAAAHFASLMIYIGRAIDQRVTQSGDTVVVGRRLMATVQKNKAVAPRLDFPVVVRHNGLIDDALSMLVFLEKNGLKSPLELPNGPVSWRGYKQFVQNVYTERRADLVAFLIEFAWGNIELSPGVTVSGSDTSDHEPEAGEADGERE